MKLTVILYRFAHQLYLWHVPLIPVGIDYLLRIVFSCWVPHSMMAGKGLVLGYGGLGVVIHRQAKIGKNVHIDQNVTIGGNAKEFGVPVIEDNVYIGAGAVIIGPVTIGHSSIIGANAVVNNSIPPCSLAVGVPAVIKKQNINSQTFLHHKKPGRL